MPSIWCLGSAPSHAYACEALRKAGIETETEFSFKTQGVLLDVPGPANVTAQMAQLPPGTPVFGGRLRGLPMQITPVDLLQDPQYTAANADITARCALRLICKELNRTLLHLPVLVIGWGRIGKLLAKYLHALDADCFVFARKPEDRALLSALGYCAIDETQMLSLLPHLELIVNTVPAIILDEETAKRCPGLLIDLASSPGIISDRVLWARGLPGKIAPESSGALIANTVIRLWKELEQ